MHWRVKGAIQKVLGWMPAGERLHYELQRRAGGLRDFDGELFAKVDDWLLMVGHLATAGIGVEGTRFLEMGTGWYPTFPFLLYLGGAARVHTVDLTRHLKSDLTRECAMRLERRLPDVARVSGKSVETLMERQQALLRRLRDGATLEDATEGVVQYRAPADASKTGLPESSVDVVFSNSVLEHVPGEVIRRCFVESWRILRPQGVIFHSVNCGDHYAYADRAINQLNYLRYGHSEWEKWNNEFLYQNRLRAVDFTTMARDVGYTIEIDTSRPHPGRLAQLDGIAVHPDFKHYSREQLAITSIDFVGRRA